MGLESLMRNSLTEASVGEASRGMETSGQFCQALRIASCDAGLGHAPPRSPCL